MLHGLRVGRQIQTTIAEWAAKHGLGRLTEVNEADAGPLVDKLQALRQPLVEKRETELAAMRAAGRLAGALRKVEHFPRKRLVVEGLLGLADSAPMIEAEGSEFWGLTDEHWAAWRERMAYADEVDAKGKVGEPR